MATKKNNTETLVNQISSEKYTDAKKSLEDIIKSKIEKKFRTVLKKQQS